MRLLGLAVVILAFGWACQSATEETTVEDAGGTHDTVDGSFDARTVLADSAVSDVATSDGDATLVDASDAGSGSDGALDGASDAPTDAGQDATLSIPTLGVYTVNTDGGGLQLLVDAGTREYSHVRANGSGWLIATRYGQDPDNNGLAMENEVGFGAFYTGTEIVAFQRGTPYAQTTIAGVPDGGLACNPSWTDDGKAIYLANGVADPLSMVHIARATFSTIPNVTSVAAIPVPAELKVPVDPHQHGASDGTGTMSFSAAINLSAKWLRPVWKMPANGTTNLASVNFVGCPICPLQGGCCGWANIGDVLGTNDSRLSHAGGDIMWMQQHPNISATVGTITFNPYRQAMRPLDGGAQVDLVAPGTASTTSLTFGEWRPDDQELVYWSIEIDGNVLRQHLWIMNRDGSNRRQVPLPAGLCPLHPSYLNNDEIIFNAWRGASPDDSCDVARL